MREKEKGRYRFSLQFGADSDIHIKVGELLERSGNRKSALIIAALSEYLASHPDLEESQGRVKLNVTRPLEKSELEQLVREEVEKQVRELRANGEDQELQRSGQEALHGDSIDLMLDNLLLFS